MIPGLPLVSLLSAADATSMTAQEHMAGDLAMLQLCLADGKARARFYLWERPAVTLGRFQQNDPVIERFKHEGFDVGIRPTGGRAVRHGWGITLGLAVKADSLGLDRLRLRRIVAGSLAEHLALVTTMVFRSARIRNGEWHWPVAACFSELSEDEAVQGPEKTVGVAGLLRDGCYLAQIECGPLGFQHFPFDQGVRPLSEQRVVIDQFKETLRQCFPNSE